MTRGEWARVAAANTLKAIGELHADLRLDCVTRLAAQLEHFGEQPETLNAMLVSPLMDLRAVEAMPVIERAFAAGRVDETVVGDVEDVQVEFGLKPKREHPREPNELTILAEKFRDLWEASDLDLPAADGKFPEREEPENKYLAPEIKPPVLPLPYIAPPKIGRNEPCPCGSGKKYKKCCGGQGMNSRTNSR